MGYVKYFEDDIKINDNRPINLEKFKLSMNDKLSIIVYECPYCHCIFEDKKDMFQHISKKHNINTPVVIVNDVVSGDNKQLFLTELNSIVIKLYGFRCNVFIDANRIEINEDEVDLTNRVRENFEKNGFCNIKVDNKEISLIQFTYESIQNPLVYEIINEWQDKTKNKVSIDKNYSDQLNEAEKNFLDGFYNYFIACNAKSDNKLQRYYDAFTLLNQFHPLNEIGSCVLKVIAFRFNWIERLHNLSKYSKDSFTMINDFYQDKSSDYFDEDYLEKTLYIEDELQENIDAIVFYQMENYKKVDNYLNGIDIYNVFDQNLKDRICLLKARRAAQQGKQRLYNMYMGEIHQLLKEDIHG